MTKKKPKAKYKSHLIRLPGYTRERIRVINELLRWQPPKKGDEGD